MIFIRMYVNDIENLIKDVNVLLKPKHDMSLYERSRASSQLLQKLSSLANKIMVYRDGKVLCKYQYLLFWRRYTINLEGDLLIAMFLANTSVGYVNSNDRFDWKLMIDHDGDELNDILKQGLVDNHYHLGGSLPAFQCVWMEIMESESYRKRIEHGFFNKQWMEESVRIREYFVELLFVRSGVLIEDDVLEGFERYYEERKFLYYMLRELMQGNSIGMAEQRLFYDYLTLKESFRDIVVQCESNMGESSFFAHNNNKNFFLSRYHDIGKVISSGINEQISSNYLKGLEIRVKMQDSPLALHEYIEWMDGVLHASKVEVRYIICFSRKKVACDDLHYRDQSKRKEVYNQIEKFDEYLKKYSVTARRITGIDICSKEGNYKPEVFAEIMNPSVCRRDGRLKRMYHTGEEYLDILSGLRAVDECICFFGLKAGDRLGHAVPIYEKVDEWYHERGGQIKIYKEEHLDDMAWLYCNLPDKIQQSAEGERILKEFQRYFGEVYQNMFESIYGIDSCRKWDFDKDFGKISIFQYFEAWKLRKEKPERIKNIFLKCADRSKRNISYGLAYCYFYNAEIKNRGHEKINIYITDTRIRLIQRMQDMVQEKIRSRGICLEICPSSNIFLGNVKKSYCHPIINLFKNAKDNLEKPDICISINTDDQGIFSTSLLNEYSILANTIENVMDKNGDMEYSRASLYRWIDKIRENSIQMFGLD